MARPASTAMLWERPFHRIVREERLFCCTLAHLLMQRGPNLERFLSLIDNRLPSQSRLPTTDIDASQVYVEFTFLRDHWNALGRDNVAKRRLVLELLSRVEGLRQYGDESFPDTESGFNEFFMGERGKRITRDIAYPGQWNVEAICSRFAEHAGVARQFCRFKWAFNIKPDIVVLSAHSKPLCIEAKLESREGQYPTSDRECRIFDSLFGTGNGRVGQLELQRFMFDVLLGEPCQPVIIGRTAAPGGDEPFLTWGHVFSELDLSSSIGFVRSLVEENEHLRPHPEDTGP